VNPYIKLAKDTITAFLKTNKIISPSKDLPARMLTGKAGVFVSIHKKDGSLRGCIGTFKPTKENIAQEILANAIAAATRDPRFPPVTEKELPKLDIKVDILSASKKVSKGKPLDPKKYGLIVSAKDGRKGLLLPSLPGVETAEEQIAICRRKAGIEPNEKVTLEIFTVERHEEK
jgi:AmmeMemoRadiSam system protein A